MVHDFLPANLEVYEVEEFLADILNHEFDTIADDGSLSQVANKFWGLVKELYLIIVG